MKRIITLVAIMTLALGLNAQDKNCKTNKSSFDNEHIAFITTEVDLSVEEAQVFWPLYNQYTKELKTSFKEYKEKFMVLKKLLENDAQEAEIATALEETISARLRQKDVFAEHAEDFKKAIGPVKTAKFYVAEEVFRNKQMQRLCGKKGKAKRTSCQAGENTSM